MILLDGAVWSIHPLAVASAREAARVHKQASATAPPAESRRRSRGKGRKTSELSESLLSREFAPEDMPLQMINGVAVVTISDVIVSWASYYYCSHPMLQQVFRYIADTRPSGGCLLLIDSPGGMAKASAETVDALNFMQDQGVNTVAQVKGGCFSAAYKLASQCRGGIYTHRMDEVGSIGTRMVLADYSAAMAKAGIEFIPITNAGATFKTLGEFGLPVTDEQREFLADYVAQVFAEFRSCVQDGRGLSDEQFAVVSDGRWWLPAEAQQLGLIDGVRTFEESLAAMQSPSSRSIFLKEESPMSKQGEKPAETPAEKPATETKPATDTTPATESAAAGQPAEKPAKATPKTDVAELQKYVTAFGAEHGTKWFIEGVSYPEACEKHIAVLNEKLTVVQAESANATKLLQEVGSKLGELDPLKLEKKETTEEAGGKPSQAGMTIAEIIAARNAK